VELVEKKEKEKEQKKQEEERQRQLVAQQKMEEQAKKTQQKTEEQVKKTPSILSFWGKVPGNRLTPEPERRSQSPQPPLNSTPFEKLFKPFFLKENVALPPIVRGRPCPTAEIEANLGVFPTLSLPSFPFPPSGN